MFSNVDYTHREVREEMKKWGEWMVNEVGVDGFRLDAVQHFSSAFTKDWMQHVNSAFNRRSNGAKDIFIVGEVWSGDRSRITAWIDSVQHPSSHPRVFAFDAPLLYNFSRISEDMRRRSKNLDLRTILRRSLLESRPGSAITLVTNHDSQPGQVCYTPMPAHSKLLWYAFILLRKHGMPCAFWGDLFGTQGPHAEAPIGIRGKDGEDRNDSYSHALVKLMLCRKLFAHGEQVDYWQSNVAIGWTRAGEENGNGCAVVLGALMAVKTTQTIKMRVGTRGEVWIDAMDHVKDETTIDANGTGVFPAGEAGISVWIKKGYESRLELTLNLDGNIHSD
jgi:alpha-amylase